MTVSRYNKKSYSENCFDITEPHIFKNLRESLRADKKIAMAALRKGVSSKHGERSLSRNRIHAIETTPC